MNFSTTRGQHVGASYNRSSAHDMYGARVFPRLVRSRLVKDSNLRCPQFQCKSVHGAPLCLSNGTMNPQKKLGTWNFVPVLSLSLSFSQGEIETQWTIGRGNRRDVDSRAVDYRYEEERRRLEGVEGKRREGEKRAHAVKQSYLILLLG